MQFCFYSIIAAFCLASAQGAINLINDAAGCVRSHNLKRALHRDTAPVTWDPTLAAGAQQWAQRLAQSGSLDHSNSQSYGENLYMAYGTSTPAICEKAVFSWYREIKDYKWKDARFTSEAGHFTQVVWKSTTKIGAGIAYDAKAKKTYIVVRYSPAGNVRGRFGQNVLPLN